jgi:two-component system, cell cycle sensor histidine kinase and response regulator CckA
VPPLILVVDDEPAVRDVACRFLQEAGFTTVAVDSAYGALELLEHGVPDLLVIDVLLPDLPGPELALRIHLRYPRVPVLFISGWPEAHASVSHLDPLHWLFVQKPFSGESLAQAARTLLGEPSEPATGATS